MQNVNDVKIINFKDIKSVKTDFLWYPYIAFGKITLIHGNPGDGKAFLSLKLAAEVSNGRALPGMPESNAKPLPVIYQTAEDGLEDTIKPRLEDTDANMENIYAIDEENKALTFADPRIEDAIVKTGAKLLIFDPLQAFIGKDVDMNKANQVREGLRPLCRLAAKYNVAINVIEDAISLLIDYEWPPFPIIEQNKDLIPNKFQDDIAYLLNMDSDIEWTDKSQFRRDVNGLRKFRFSETEKLEFGGEF